MVFRRTLAERERIQGQRHQDVTATRQQLAEAYLADGRPKPAIQQYERVVSTESATSAPTTCSRSPRAAPSARPAIPAARWPPRCA